MSRLKRFLSQSLLNNTIGRFILNKNFKTKYRSAAAYWESRYQQRGTSGIGSYGSLASYKATILNRFVAENNISSVLELGCGDGNQLKQFEFPSYVGLDVSVTAIEKCMHIFKSDATKNFFIYEPGKFAANSKTFKAELTLSLDVVYHLLEDDVFETYMRHLFSSSTQFVVIYAWDVEGHQKLHIRHRKFTNWIKSNLVNWDLIQTIKNENNFDACDFFIYEKRVAL